MEGLKNDKKKEYLGSHELRGAEEDLQLLHWFKSSRETKVDDLDPVARLRQAQDVLRLKGYKLQVERDRTYW